MNINNKTKFYLQLLIMVYFIFYIMQYFLGYNKTYETNNIFGFWALINPCYSMVIKTPKIKNLSKIYFIN